MSNSKAPLQGIKIIELGTHAAVPATTRILADWGADVIKIEGLKGDEWRVSGKNLSTPVLDDENPLFTFTNANKKMIALNLKTEEGKEVLFRLIREADVFISNVRIKSLNKMGLDYDALKAVNPRLIYCHFTGFGYNGPDAAKPGFDKTSFWSKSGALVDWAFVEGPPINPVTAFGDFTVASLMASGVLAGFIGREKTGEGTFLSSSLYGCAIWYNANPVVANQQCYINDLNRFPKSVMRPLLPFSHFYKCGDGEWVMITVIDHDGNYEKVMTALGLEEYIPDERFRTIVRAKENIETFIGILNERFRTKSSDEWLDILDKADIVCQKLLHMKDVTEDPQAWENDYLERVTFSSGTTAVMPRVPVQFSNFKVDRYDPTGAVGRDTEAVLSGLGYSQEQIDAYRQKQAVK